ncbi:pathogenic type III effector avirulence factor Avr AvrRpt-cleavage: cleavage site protein [Medicago truncatula]|uniref:Pathogenic type III effector avirulence factor Avr AvrRpt-cleavage: cleavage site protein n=1 Tax=Medicago truncatula TaxID=3880 RepID=G7IG22_MEDTR|nr:pathogenic type III effector avirulence factor Avr AvrRpt-cleavage: cleavage site protein [Medicago truncatula]
MERHSEENSPCPPVPRFGEWDQKGPIRDYSMDFSKIQEARKQLKSLGNEEELKASFRHIQRQRTEHDASPTRRKSFLKWFSCCIKF